MNICSLNGQVVFTVDCKSGKPFYTVSYKGKTVYDKAPLGLKIGGVDYSENVTVDAVETVTVSRSLTLLGRVRDIDDRYVQATVAMTAAGVPCTLDVRVYDNGVAFRYIYDKAAGKTVNAEYTAFKVAADSYVYASFGCRGKGCQRFHRFAHYNGICYEASYGRFPVKDIFSPTANQIKFHDLYEDVKDAENFILTPMAVEFSDGLFGAILEGNLTDYVGVNLRQKGNGLFELNTTYQPERQFVDFDVTRDNVVTPYRILTVAENLNDLYNNTIVYSVNEAPEGDYSWVKPGRSAWSWRSNGSFVGTIETMYAYNEAAAKLGLEYNILDGRWSMFANDVPSLFDMVKKLCDDMAPYKVEQVVWNGYTVNEARFPLGKKDEELTNGVRIFNPDWDAIETFMKNVSALGVTGLKIDFFPPEDQVEGGVNLYEKTAKLAAKYNLVVNFHGATKPTGLNITYPNVVNYEGIFGHEMAPVRQPVNETQLFTTQYLTRGLAGHADFTPQVQNAYGLAELVFVDAPFNAIDATPAELIDSPAVEFIKACPTVWDNTKVLSVSVYEQFAAMARVKDGNWFLGVINNREAGVTEIKLDEFLGEGTYICDLYTDQGNTRKLVTKADVLAIELPENSGYAARFSKVALSAYGGEIKDAVSIDLVDEGLTAYYTLDGTDPAVSETAVVYTAPITLTDTCRLQVSVKDPDGNLVSELSYQFNNITAPIPSMCPKDHANPQNADWL